MRRFLRPLVERRTYHELAYVVLDLPVGVALFTLMVTLVTTGAAMVVTVVGIPLLAFTMVVARSIGTFERARAVRLLGTAVDAPCALPPVHGRWPWIRIRLSDPVAWRTVCYSILLLPVGVFTFSIAVTAWALALGALTLPAWNWALPNGGAHLFSGVVIRTPGQLVVVAACGIAFLPLAPWAVRACIALDRALVRSLLTPVSLTRQVEWLRSRRDLAVDAAASERRRIERDLHDGAQARLVAVAMDVGRAREHLKRGADAETAVLLDEAHQQAKRALVEVRNLARGIHPAILNDGGLDAALSSLVAACPVPVDLTVNLDRRLPPPVESAAYFVVAEALTNVARHSGATVVAVYVGETVEGITVDVSDDGSGGADPVLGSGLSGLDSRVAALGGHLSVTSPLGGPTVIHAEVPCGS